MVSRHIKNASETLTRLNLIYDVKDTLEHCTAPFKEVEELTFGISDSELKHSNLPFDQLFPKLRMLNVSFSSNADLSYITCKLPRLDYLNVHIVNEKAWPRIDQIKELLRENSHVRGAEIQFAPKSFITLSLKNISELLPNLEYIKLHTFWLLGEPVHFDHVKELVLEEHYPESVDLMSMPCLESISFMYYRSSYREWNNFFVRHSNVKRLSVLVVSGDPDPATSLRSMGIINGLPELIDFTLASFTSHNVDLIREIIENHPELMRIRFAGIMPHVSTHELDHFQEEYENEWHFQSYVDSSSLEGFAMERKIQQP